MFRYIASLFKSIKELLTSSTLKPDVLTVSSVFEFIKIQFIMIYYYFIGNGKSGLEYGRYKPANELIREQLLNSNCREKGFCEGYCTCKFEHGALLKQKGCDGGCYPEQFTKEELHFIYKYIVNNHLGTPFEMLDFEWLTITKEGISEETLFINGNPVKLY